MNILSIEKMVNVFFSILFYGFTNFIAGSLLRHIKLECVYHRIIDSTGQGLVAVDFGIYTNFASICIRTSNKSNHFVSLE